MQAALYHTANPSDFMRHNNDCIKSRIARPVRTRDICFGRPAQACRLGAGNRGQTCYNIGAAFNLYKNHQIPTPCDYINFCASGITAGHVSGFYNTESMQTQIHPRNKFRNQTCFIRIHSGNYYITGS